MNEFEIIRRYFQYGREAGDASARGEESGKAAVMDDAAVIKVGGDGVLVVSSDTLVEGEHFFADVLAERLARKAAAVSVSDIAAMGGRAAWMTVALTASDKPARWFAQFADGMRASAAEYGFAVVGGDLTRGKQASVTTTAIGVCRLPPLLRSGARAGDDVWVSGTVGEAAYALDLMRRERAGARGGELTAALRARLETPTARAGLGAQLPQWATAAIDLSDGLLICARLLGEASGVELRLEAEAAPVADTMKHLAAEDLWRYVFCGGDDYELLFTAPAAARAEIARRAEVAAHRVGRVAAARGGGAVALWRGEQLAFADDGYEHSFG